LTAGTSQAVSGSGGWTATPKPNSERPSWHNSVHSPAPFVVRNAAL
jgi:hypothetical protein